MTLLISALARLKLAVEGGDGVDYGALFVFAELGVDGESQDLGGGGLSHGEIAGLVA
jgi:hypothetical protein